MMTVMPYRRKVRLALLTPNVAYQSAAKKKGAPKGALAAPTRAVRSREGDGRSVPFPAGSAPVRGA
jgi:hypothetical protein